jgi:hypothetical protein
MRAIWTSWGMAGLVGFGSGVACGEPKTAKDVHDWPEPPPPSAESTDTPNTSSPSSPAPTSHASVDSPPPPSSSGVSYDKEAVEVVLKRAARQVKANCGAATDEDGKATGPWGKVTVNVKLGHNGHSQGATVASMDGKPVGKCVAQAFASMQYPPFAGPDTTIDWEVEVVKPAGAH